MGNHPTIEARIISIEPKNKKKNKNDGYQIQVENIDGRCFKLHLKKDNKNYVQIMKEIEPDKLYKFKLSEKPTLTFTPLVNVNKLDIYKAKIKIRDFIDLSKLNSKLEGMCEIIYKGKINVKLITKEVVDTNTFYHVSFTYNGICNYYYATSLQKIEKAKSKNEI